MGCVKQNRLDDLYASLLDRRAQQGRLRRLTVPAPGVVDFSSNSYLSLLTNPEIRSVFLSRVHSSPLSQGVPLGCGGGSRLLDGNYTAAEDLERTIASFHGAPAGLLFNSGFAANTGLFSCAPQKGDVVVYDELIHASVHDGMRLGRARTIPFAHNSVSSDADLTLASGNIRALDDVLFALTDGAAGRSARTGQINVFIAVESVYSMDGDIAPLQEIVECVERRLPHGNGYIVVDEAHATGWLGDCGRGLVCHLGLEDRVWARVHTFGKSLGCAGAIVLCSPTTRSYLINYARSLIYTTAMGYHALAGIQTAYEFLMRGQAEPHLRHLRALMSHVHRLLTSLCARRQPLPQIFRVNTEEPESPIIPLFTSQARSLALHCQQRGFMLRPIVAPTVPEGTDRVRLCLHAGNTMDEVQGLCDAVEEWVCARLAELDTVSLRASMAGTQRPPSKI
ncbi:hypothetical protein HIM_01163 [Hirsutella minnesotensis 3608]|nr:hypothetical protein HIM_01163 [Hirsutella minnesotensis 3608]